MTRPRFRRVHACIAGLMIGWSSGIATAQTTSAPGIDVEVYNPLDGSNSFCSVPNVAFWAHVFLRPGDDFLSCDRPCGNDIPGGSASIATALVDIAFDTSSLSVLDAQSNPDPTYAAVDGIPQLQNLDTGRIGWALEGDWVVDGDPASGFKDPCVMQKLQSEGWVFRVQFIAASETTTSLHVRRQTDPSPFELSLADICENPAFTVVNGGIDEVVDAVVTVDWACCSFSIEPASAVYGPEGGSGNVEVATQGECPWTATSDVDWATVTSGSQGAGSGTVSYDVAANASPNPRTGTLTIAGHAFTIDQAGITCSYSVDPTTATFGASGGFGSIAVATQDECPWTAVSNIAWATVTSGSSGTGPGTVTYEIAANSSPDPRTGTLTVAGQTFTVNQEGITCAYSIEPTSASYDASGGSGSTAVTTQDECPWNAVSNVGWSTVTSGSSGTGPGTVTYDVAGNTSPDPRNGTLTVAGLTFTIDQEGLGFDVFSDGFESGDTSAWSATVP